MSNFSHRNAFTLIEILVVLIILSILAAMVTTAVSGVQTTAREARTKRIISVVDSVIAEHYEQLRYRPLSVEIPRLYRDVPGSQSLLGWEALADESARVRLVMLRDLQRLEIPDRYSDIVKLNPSYNEWLPLEVQQLAFEPPATLYAAVSQVVSNDGQILKRRENLDDRQSASVDWFGDQNNKQPNHKQYGFLQRLESAKELRNNNGNVEARYTWTTEHQGAECLYLVLSTCFVGGQPAIGAIPDSNIGDTDKDGMPEILDGWGQPLQFVRWPVGFTPSNLAFSVDFENTVNVETVDDFDIFRADYAYLNGADQDSVWVRDANNPSVKYRPWSMRPLVFSVGEDGESGLAINPGDQPGFRQHDFSYASPAWYWPNTEDYLGIEQPGRVKMAYIDPYLRVFSANNQGRSVPGELLGSSDSVEYKRSFNQFIDNITNYRLQVSP